MLAHRAESRVAAAQTMKTHPEGLSKDSAIPQLVQVTGDSNLTRRQAEMAPRFC
jgi:hypothetical protein